MTPHFNFRAGKMLCAFGALTVAVALAVSTGIIAPEALYLTHGGVTAAKANTIASAVNTLGPAGCAAVGATTAVAGWKMALS